MTGAEALAHWTATVRREAYRWAVLALVQVRVWRARRWDRRSKMLRLDAQWERQEAQQMLDDLPPSLLSARRR